jgi:hypothetical protein
MSLTPPRMRQHVARGCVSALRLTPQQRQSDVPVFARAAS